MYFHFTFIFIFVGMMAIRAFYFSRAQKYQGPVTYKEARMTRLRRTLGLPFPILLLVYMIYPSSLGWFDLDLPVWAQWLGLAFGLLSLGLAWWVHRALDIQFSDVLHVREAHILVRHGPYRWVRHPMYTSLFLNGLAVLLLTRNGLIGGFYLISLSLIVAFRIRNEERVMVQQFGEAYIAYMRQTDRFIPGMRALRSGDRKP